jgi:tetratricopeptide (TPR) repeat protein
VLVNLKGLTAMVGGRLDEAEAAFRQLLGARPDDRGAAYNLAWTLSLKRDWEGALGLLDDAAVGAVPEAATLRIQMLHRLGRLDEALALGAGYAEARPDDQALMSALAIAAMDDERKDLARIYALRGGASHEALATLGALSLDASRVEEAARLFDQALAARADSARGLMGKGLCLMVGGDPAGGAAYLDRSAEAFGSHIGTWVAAGWAHLTSGDIPGARQRFETALALDERFAESQGALAVLDVMEGDLEGGRRRAEVAFRLDRNCLSAALARSLLAERAGDARTAERIRAMALNTPLGEDGRTLAQAIAAFGARGPTRH